MTDDAVNLSRGLPETVLPAPPEEWTEALADAFAMSGAERETRSRPLPARTRVSSRPGPHWPSWPRTRWSPTPTPASATTRARRATGRGLARLGLRALAARDEPWLPALSRGPAPSCRSDGRDRRGAALCAVPQSARSGLGALGQPAVEAAESPVQPRSSRHCRPPLQVVVIGSQVEQPMPGVVTQVLRDHLAVKLGKYLHDLSRAHHAHDEFSPARS